MLLDIQILSEVTPWPLAVTDVSEDHIVVIFRGNMNRLRSFETSAIISQSSRQNILEDSNILRTQWPVSRSSHSNPGKINPVPNKQKVAWLRAALNAVQKWKILYPSGHRRIPLSLKLQLSLQIIGPLLCTCFKMCVNFRVVFAVQSSYCQIWPFKVTVNV